MPTKCQVAGMVKPVLRVGEESVSRNRPWVKSLGLLLVGMVLGLLLSLQWKAMSAIPADSVSERDQTALTIARLESEQDSLKQRVGELRQSLDEKQQARSQSAELVGGLAQELARQRALAGLTPLVGPGVQVILNDSTRSVIPSQVNPESYLVHDYDVRDVINLLWAADSEAIAINGERIVANSSIYCVGATIMVNDTRMSPPYQIRAIGPPERQEALLTNVELLSDFRNRVSLYGLEFKVTPVEELLLPAYGGSFGVTYASIAGE